MGSSTYSDGPASAVAVTPGRAGSASSKRGPAAGASPLGAGNAAEVGAPPAAGTAALTSTSGAGEAGLAGCGTLSNEIAVEELLALGALVATAAADAAAHEPQRGAGDGEGERSAKAAGLEATGRLGGQSDLVVARLAESLKLKPDLARLTERLELMR